jgi:FAD/FMN-containing dehydrogenase
MKDGALAALRSRFGEPQVLHGADAAPFERDWRGQYPGRALAVLRPRDVAEVQAMLRAAAEFDLAVVPQGGNTGLVGGSTPDDSGRELVLSLTRLNRLRALRRDDLSLTAEAGCVLADLQAAAAAQGLLLPLSLAAEGSCTLGGNLATNAGGTQVLRWGNARDLCLGLEVVTADGALWSDLDGLRKDHRGFNLRDLFIGSEGCLGVITAAVMALAPQPRTRLAAWLTLDTLADAMTVLAEARAAAGEALSGFEAMAAEVQALCPTLPLPLAPWAVLMEWSSADDEPEARARLEALLAGLLQAGCVRDAVLSQSQAQFEALWALREGIPEAQTRAGGNVKHDISLPLSALPAFCEAAAQALQAICPGLRPQVFGHLGDGNLHYNVAPPVGMALADFRQRHGEAVTQAVFDTVAAHGGSFSAEHGIGRLRREELARRADPVAMALMRRVKQALDPANRLNPGRVLGAAPWPPGGEPGCA